MFCPSDMKLWLRVHAFRTSSDREKNSKILRDEEMKNLHSQACPWMLALHALAEKIGPELRFGKPWIVLSKTCH